MRRDPASEGWRFRTRVLTEFSHRATELALEPLSPTEAAELLGRLLPGAFDDETREGDRRAGGGQSALPRGVAARSRRGRRPGAAPPHVDDRAEAVPDPAASAREPPRRPDRSAALRAAAARPGGGGDRPRVSRCGARARRRRDHDRRSRGAAAGGDRSRGSPLPGASLRLPTWAAPGRGPDDADAVHATRPLRARRRRLRGALRRLARRPPRAARALSRAGWHHLCGRRVSRARGRGATELGADGRAAELSKRAAKLGHGDNGAERATSCRRRRGRRRRPGGTRSSRSSARQTFAIERG